MITIPEATAETAQQLYDAKWNLYKAYLWYAEDDF
jgi:hypothetical protein